jgi:outer membrane protein TolC
VEQLAYQAAELKFNQGSISKNALLTAADELQTAKEAVLTAENNLFSTYNEYTWAVKYGIFM